MDTTNKASYKKLRDGSWGIQASSRQAAPGSTIQVQTKAGYVKTETIKAVLWTGDGKSICSIEPSSRPHRSTSSRKRSYEPGYAPIKGCGACRQLGRMCKQCEFDEYDM